MCLALSLELQKTKQCSVALRATSWSTAANQFSNSAAINVVTTAAAARVPY
jgi:hypothetical protein